MAKEKDDDDDRDPESKGEIHERRQEKAEISSRYREAERKLPDDPWDDPWAYTGLLSRNPANNIREYWTRVTPMHKDITVTTELFGIANDQGFARFYAEYTNLEEVPSTFEGTAPEEVTIRLDGVCIISLQGTLCDRFREWWHREPF